MFRAALENATAVDMEAEETAMEDAATEEEAMEENATAVNVEAEEAPMWAVLLATHMYLYTLKQTGKAVACIRLHFEFN